MMDKETKAQVWLAVIVIFIVGCLISDAVEELGGYLINECQAELPRNQTCKLIAVVDEGE